jgi:ketosteroid isomerase-like protein
MPSRETVDAFIALVEQGQYIEALEGYYLPDATMQENQDAPRGGLEALVAGERQVMAAFKPRTRPVGAVLVDGDLVMINWIFEFTAQNGQTVVMDELALQRWRGDKIIAEQFYYDPAQRKF